MTTLKSLTGLIFLLFLFTTTLGAATIYVPDNYATIQGAIQAAANGDVIRVRPGTYTENIDFLGKRIIVNSLQGPAATTIDGDMVGSGAVFTHGEGPETVLRGFTLTNGIGFFDHVELRTLGGGIYCFESSPSIDNCRVEGNSANHGGGIYCAAASPLITDCVLEGNVADIGGGLFCKSGQPQVRGCTVTGNAVEFYGGGIYCWEASAAIISSTISQNGTNLTASGGGGGIYIYGVSTPVISDNLIIDNSTSGLGGGVCCSENSNAMIIGNEFSGNYGNFGGAVSCRGDAGSITIVGNRMAGNSALTAGGGIFSENASTTIIDNTVTGNDGGGYGGGISSSATSGGYVDIHRCRVKNNSALVGGGICVFSGVLRLTGCRITGNSATGGGGLSAASLNYGTLEDNIFHNNQADYGGGMRIHFGGAVEMDRNTFTANSADFYGGGIYCREGTSLTVIHGIFWGDISPSGKEVYLDYDAGGLSLNIDYSDVDGGIGSLVVETGCTLNWGEGMIDADPLFVDGPAGGFYLSQVAAGQAMNSPCVDAGDPAAGGASGTTRTDGFSDMGIVDLGMHNTTGSLVAGAGPGEDNPPLVRLFSLQQGAAHDHEFEAYGADHFGVNVHAGDLDGDGVDEIITGAGPGEIYGPHVRGFGSDGQPFAGVSFLAYGTNRFGVNVAAGDLDGDGKDEIVTGAGPGAVFGPHVRGFDVLDSPPGTAAIPGVSFIAYGTSKWGVNVASGDIDGDGFDEIITGAGPGTVFGPHVRGWNVDGGTAAVIPAVSFLAYGTQRFGVRVACGDLDGDGIDELVTAPGPSPTFSSHIRGWNYDGAAVAPLANCSFFALPPTQYRYGAQVFAGADLDGDGRAEMVVGAGPDEGADSTVAVYRYSGTAVSQWFTLQAMPGAWRYGSTVAAGHF